MATPSATCIGCAMSGSGSPRALFDIAEKVSEPHGSTVDKISAAVQGLCSKHLEGAIILHTCMSEALERRSKNSLRAVRDDEGELVHESAERGVTDEELLDTYGDPDTSTNPFAFKTPTQVRGLEAYKDLSPRHASPFEPRQHPLHAALQNQLKTLLDTPITVATLGELHVTSALALQLLQLKASQ